MKNTIQPMTHELNAGSATVNGAPPEVRWALKLLWLGLAVGVGQYLYFLPVAMNVIPSDPATRGPAIFGMAMPVLGFIAGAFLNVMIKRGKNWARIVKLLFAIAGLVPQLWFSPALTWRDYIGVGLVPALYAVAFYLLFLTRGRRWFARPSSGREGC